jgi:SEC-C motif-containing protein
MSCYCGVGDSFEKCCKPLHEGKLSAETAEQMMRSRFSAFCVRNLDYVKRTTDPQLFTEIDWNANEEWMNSVDFFKLEIVRAEESGNKATIEFKAHFKVHEKVSVHHEISKFRKSHGEWFFRDGRTVPPPKDGV